MAPNGVGKAGSLYESILASSNADTKWFTIGDTTSRVARVLVTYYVLMFTHPISFFIFLTRYNMLWEKGGGLGLWFGFFSTVLTYPIYPLTFLITLLAKRWFMEEPAYATTVFFQPPKGTFSAILWEYYKGLSPPMAQFMMNRGDKTAIAHSWYDAITDKHFWRSILEGSGAAVPRELGRWKDLGNGEWGVEWFYPLKGEDIVIKLRDESNGIGDAFLYNGTGEGEIADQEAMERYMRETKGEQQGCGTNDDSGLVYNNKEALILEWVRPSTAKDAAGEQECHSLDIMTVEMSPGNIEVVTCLYWGDCSDGKTTHSTQGGYVCDVENDKIGATCDWYAPYFANMPINESYTTGHDLPGIAECCELVIKAHKYAMQQQPWLKMIGWDAIVSRTGPIFFEGNYAQMRLPRRVFLSWDATFKMIGLFVFNGIPWELVAAIGIALPYYFTGSLI